MTDFEQLKQQIEQYVRTGMTETKRQQLISQAGKIGINPGQLVMLIKNAELGTYVPFDQEDSDPDHPMVGGAGTYAFAYHGKAAAAGKTVSQVAKDLGWSETVWDLSGEFPKLK